MQCGPGSFSSAPENVTSAWCAAGRCAITQDAPHDCVMYFCVLHLIRTGLKSTSSDLGSWRQQPDLAAWGYTSTPARRAVGCAATKDPFLAARVPMAVFPLCAHCTAVYRIKKTPVRAFWCRCLTCVRPLLRLLLHGQVQKDFGP